MIQRILMKLSLVLVSSIIMGGFAGTPGFAQSADGDGEGDGIGQPGMFRKNVSKTPEAASAKSKINIMGIWFDALHASSGGSEGIAVLATYTDESGVEQEGVPYYQDTCLTYDPENENKCIELERDLIRVAMEAKPLVVTYTDVTFTDTDGHEYADVFAAVSRDDGNTWKRKNLSRMADLSSFTLANGKEYYGDCKKPVTQVKGNKIFVTWSSKYARGGKPRYAIQVCPPDEPDCEVCTGSGDNEQCGPDYTFDDPYYTDDIWGVAGAQQSVDYADYDYNISYPEVGEVPYSVVWCVRGIIATQSNVNSGLGQFAGDIVWFKPERLTSGRRDAYQLFAGGSSKGDFGIVWQEDPEGLFPGKGYGPGSGWSGARTNRGTDIWYSYITYKDFAQVDTNFVSGGDPQHDEEVIERPKALVPMTLPVRITDNLNANTKNTRFYDADGNLIDGTGTNIDEDKEGERRYITEVEGLWPYDPATGYSNPENGFCTGVNEPADGFCTYVNQNGETITSAVTFDGRLLDGDTGASRPNLFLQTYDLTPSDPNDDNFSAWAIMGYEETKGLGAGPPDDTGTGDQPQDGSGNDEYKADEGKCLHYHSFKFTEPDLVSDGNILNLQATSGDTLYPLNEGELLWLLDEEGNEILDIWGERMPAYQSAKRVRFLLQGKSAAAAVNPGKVCNASYPCTTLIAVWRESEEGRGRTSDIMLRRNVVTSGGNPYSFSRFQGVQNMSSVNADLTYLDPEHDPTSEDPRHDGTKVIRWSQTVDNLDDHTALNPYDDSRAMRGQIRGDKVMMGYIWTPNYYAATNYNDKYDFYIRRSFDAGATWTTSPTADAGDCVEHIDIYQDPEAVENADKHYEVETTYCGPNVWEPARNVSLLWNSEESGLEPRIVSVPGTIKASGQPTGHPEDIQNPNVCYLSYGLEDQETQTPTDMFWSVTDDWGQTLKWVQKTINPDSDGNHPGDIVEVFDWLAKDKDAEEGEAQIRMTPSGERMYTCWLEEAITTLVLGDMDGDSDVDSADFSEFFATFPLCEGQEGYNADADYDGDGCITFVDYQMWYGYYAQGGGPTIEEPSSDIIFRRIMDPLFPANWAP